MGTCLTPSEPLKTMDAQLKQLTNHQRQIWQKYIHIEGVPKSSFSQINQSLIHICFTQISKDIERTYPNLAFFSIPNNLKRFEILLKRFGLYFPRVGYTQGLNFLSGYLLLCGYDDEYAFRMLVRICLNENIMGIGLYEDDFPLARFYCQLFWKLMEQLMPKVVKQLRSLKFPDDGWIFQWFISFYIYSFPIQYMKQIWEFILSKGQFSLVLLALGIVKCIEKDLLQLSDDYQYFQYFESLKVFQICILRLDIRKAIQFQKNITKSQIQSAIICTECHSNLYKRYFLSNHIIRNQKWMQIIRKMEVDREQFKKDPTSSVYLRNRDITHHLQNYVIQKYKMYKSDFRHSRLRHSNLQIIRYSVAYSLPQGQQFIQKSKELTEKEDKKQ